MSGVWTVVVPLRSWSTGKSRLSPFATERRALAQAIGLDTVEAVAGAAAVGRVAVVTDSDEVAADARSLGVHALVRAPAVAPVERLREAVDQGITWAGERHPTRPTAVVLGDLPCLTALDVDVVLLGAWRHQHSFVRDGARGTTMLLGGVPGDLRPRFGPGSAEAHARTGARELIAVPASARHDVDTPVDLQRARTLGTGPRTQALLTGTPVGTGHPSGRPAG